MKRYISMFLLLALAAAGCQKNVSPSLELASESETVDCEGVTLNIPVKCNTSLRAHVEYAEGSDSDWVMLLPRVLNGDGVLMMIVEPYKGVLSNRHATVVVDAQGLVKSIDIEQLAKDGIGLSSEKLKVAMTEGRYEVTVASNKEWTATVTKGDWISIVQGTGGQGENPLSIEVADAAAKYGQYGYRTGSVHVATDVLSADLEIIQGYGTIIGGLRWADANVDQPGTFAATPDAPGCMYQYNSKTPWPATGPAPSGYPTGYFSGPDTWAQENNPCPEGWRIPEIEEIRALYKGGFYFNGWNSTGFGHDGAMLGNENVRTATKDDMKGCIFVPCYGFRHPETGELLNDWVAQITSITRPGQNWDRWIVSFTPSQTVWDFGGSIDGSNNTACSVRCVANVLENE